MRPRRLLAMALWAPRVLVFALRLPGRVAGQPLPDLLEALTPRRADGWPRLTPEELARVAWNVLRFRTGPLNHGCFVRSFTRYHFLRRLGYPVVFHLGIEERTTGDASPLPPIDLAADAARRLRSHAWLTLDGRPLLEPDIDVITGYRPLFRWPPGGAS